MLRDLLARASGMTARTASQRRASRFVERSANAPSFPARRRLSCPTGSSLVTAPLCKVLGTALAALCLVAAPTGARAQQSFEQGPKDALGTGAGKVKPSAEVTFSGYKTLPGGRGLVFVELTAPVAVEVTRHAQVLEYRLVGATVPLKNNKNPLILRDFKSSATSAVLVSDRSAVRLVVTLRDNVSPSHRLVARGQGAVLEVELPAPPAAPR